MRKLFFSLFLLPCVLAVSAQETFNIMDYGASILSLDNTKAIQATIDAAVSAGGGQVLVPTGKFATGTIILHSNIDLHLNLGAELSGLNDTLAYPVIVATTFRSNIDGECQRSLVFAEGADNVKITGLGTINGNGFLPPFAGASSKIRPFGVRFVSCSNVLFKDVTLTFSGFWMQHILNCTDVLVDGIKIFNHGNSNNDGINIDCSKNVVVRNCWVDSSDDGIAIKSTGETATENILVEDCILATLSRGVKIGTESIGAFKNVVIRNCDIDASILSNPLFLPGRIGISASSVDGAVLEDFVYENLTFRGYKEPFLLRLGDRGKLPSPESLPKGAGIYRNVLIKNIEVRADQNIPSIISGIPGHYIENIQFEDIEITYPGSFQGSEMNPDSVPENIAGKPSEDMFGDDMVASAFFIRHAKNISMKNVCLSPYIPEAREHLVYVDVLNTDLESTEAGTLFSPFRYCINNKNVATGISGNTKDKPYKILRRVNEINLQGKGITTVSLFSMNGKLIKSFDKQSQFVFSINKPIVLIINSEKGLFKEKLLPY